jgi:hypothetical protein
MSFLPDAARWFPARTALRQTVGLAIIGAVCFTGQLAVHVEELVAQAAGLIASGPEDS